MLLSTRAVHGSAASVGPAAAAETPDDILKRCSERMAALHSWQTEWIEEEPHFHVKYIHKATYFSQADTYESREEVSVLKAGKPWYNYDIIVRDSRLWMIYPDRKLALRFPMLIPSTVSSESYKRLHKQLADHNLSPRSEDLRTMVINIGSQPCFAVVADFSKFAQSIEQQAKAKATVAELAQKLPFKITYVITKDNYILLGFRIYNQSGQIVKDTVVSSLKECAPPAKELFDLPAGFTLRYPSDVAEYENLAKRPLPVSLKRAIDKKSSLPSKSISETSNSQKE